MLLLKIFSCGPLQTNAVLIACLKTREAAIVDAPKGCCSVLAKVISQENLIPKMLLLTHTHWDHIADASELKIQHAIPIYVHPLDRANLENPGADLLPLLFPVQGVIPDQVLEDRQEILLGLLKIQVIFTPGHSPGGVCFFIADEKILISGDTLFRGTIGNLSFPTSRPDLMKSSLQRLAELPDDTIVIPGHGENTTIGAERWIFKGGRYE